LNEQSEVSSTDPEVVKAIPRSEKIKQVIIAIAVVLLVNFIAKRALWPAVHRYLESRDPVEAMRRFKLFMLIFGLCLLPLALYFAVLAGRILRSRQFPYPGATVWRDTRIVRGRRALIRGWGLAVCALAFVGMAIFAAYIPYTVASKPHGHLSVGSGK